MRILLALVFTLPLLSTAPAEGASVAQSAFAGGPTIETAGRGRLTFTSMTQDPNTGLIQISGDVVATGTFGYLTGTDSYTIDPTTGAFVGSGTRVGPDGSTYEILFQGQFISATDSIGIYTVPDTGTGRFENVIGSGSFFSRRWDNGAGSHSTFAGTATRLL